MLIKDAKIINKLINKSLFLLINNKTIIEILTIFNNRFQQITYISIFNTFTDICNQKTLKPEIYCQLHMLVLNLIFKNI